MKRVPSDARKAAADGGGNERRRLWREGQKSSREA